MVSDIGGRECGGSQDRRQPVRAGDIGSVSGRTGDLLDKTPVSQTIPGMETARPVVKTCW